ncbi:MAG: L,D-transpeptidase family protein [Planctomycetia bacterium]|nr:L,D-transpeptidase family protein [Planctomycetia bacterium]
MTRWFSLTKVLTVAILGFAGFVVFRSGWIPVEFGGTETGSVIDADSKVRHANYDADGLAPDFEPGDSVQPIDVCGVPNGVLSEQSEPELEEAVIERPELRATSSLRAPKLLELPEADEPQPRLISPSGIAQPSTRRSRSTLQLVSEELPAATEPATKSERVEKKETSSAVEEQFDAPPEPTTVESPSEPAVRIAKKPEDKEPAIDLSLIDRQFQEGKLVEAHKALSKIYWQQPDQRTRIQERIDASAKAIYFSPQRHIQEPYVVQSGDQLRKIASKYHVPWQYIAKLNRTDPKRIREGQKLKVIDGPFGGVVTLSDFELVIHHQGQYVRSYRVCIGKDGSSPVGKFKILNKVANPQYTDPDGKVFSGNDPKNPLGKFWLDLGESYGIHGTIEPNSIGKAESRGCIRLINEDVAEIYDILDVSSEVIIRE